MDLILLRHGETKNNTEKTYNEETTPLNERGVAQIERASDQINNMIIDKVLVSPHTRTRQTFDIIKQYHDLPYEIYEGIREIDAGAIKGQSYDQARLFYPDIMDEYMEDHINTRFPQGESVMDAYKRAGRFLEEVKSMHCSVLAISHMGFISLVLANIMGDPYLYDKFHIDNGGFTLIRMSEYPTIRYINRI